MRAEIRPYGIFDAGVSLINDGVNKSTQLTSGTGTASRLGVRGNEVITNRLSAEFLLETFITLDDGSNYGVASKYNSATFVGIKYKKFLNFSNSLAEFSIRLGRQRNVLHDRLYLYDPMRQNLIGSPTGFALYSMFYDKMLKMIAKFKNDNKLVLFRFMFIPGDYKRSLRSEYTSIYDSHSSIPFGTWGTSIRFDNENYSIKTGYQTETSSTYKAKNSSYLLVGNYYFKNMKFFAGTLLREPGVQLFNEADLNSHTQSLYFGFSLPIRKIFENYKGLATLSFSYAKVESQAIQTTKVFQNSFAVSKVKYYSANQWGVAIKQPLSNKTSVYLFAGKLINAHGANFSLEAIPYDIQTGAPGHNPSVIGFSINQRY